MIRHISAQILAAAAIVAIAALPAQAQRDRNNGGGKNWPNGGWPKGSWKNGGGKGNDRKRSDRTAPSKGSAKATQKLPEQYRSRDTDGDGQIGLYEWSKNDYAGFAKLDLNGDGFLTPQELTKGPSKTAMASVASSRSS